jgi:hypothetical protein
MSKRAALQFHGNSSAMGFSFGPLRVSFSTNRRAATIVISQAPTAGGRQTAGNPRDYEQACADARYQTESRSCGNQPAHESVLTGVFSPCLLPCASDCFLFAF